MSFGKSNAGRDMKEGRLSTGPVQIGSAAYQHSAAARALHVRGLSFTQEGLSAVSRQAKFTAYDTCYALRVAKG
jgi:hypothetical protein